MHRGTERDARRVKKTRALRIVCVLSWHGRSVHTRCVLLYNEGDHTAVDHTSISCDQAQHARQTLQVRPVATHILSLSPSLSLSLPPSPSLSLACTRADTARSLAHSQHTHTHTHTHTRARANTHTHTHTYTHIHTHTHTLSAHTKRTH